jgi:hypothetical protein
MAQQEFQGQNVIIHEGTSIKGKPGAGNLTRQPDVWVEDAATGRVLKVYEAARKEGGQLVPREGLKKQQYDRLGIPSHFEEVN